VPSPTALAELRDRLGELAVRTDPDEVAGHVVPWRGPRGDAAAVVRPADVDQVRTTVRWAREHRVRLVPQGANTGLVGASTPPSGSDAVVLSMSRLDAPPAVDAVERTAVVQAGVLLSSLNEAAAPHGLSLPIDLGADPTLGGMVSTNTGGARMLRHGDLRAAVLGVQAVLADEACSVVDELTTLRKHNVGPSMGRLMVGAGGALGVVTAVALELSPLPADRATAWCRPASTDALVGALEVLERAWPDDLSAFEVVSGAALAAAQALPAVRVRPFGTAPLPEHTVLIEFEGAAGAEDRLVGALGELGERGLLTDAVVLPPDDAWSVRHAVSEGLGRLGTVVGIDVSVRRRDLPALVSAVRETVGSQLPGVQVADFGHWGDGGVHCNLVLPRHDGPTDEELVERARRLVLELVVERFDGSFSAEHGVGPLNAHWWSSTTSEGTRALLARVARAADPLGILGHPGLPYRGAPSSSAASSAEGNGAENR
jgi:FAD/FMN-containing dehydrogenase